MYAISVFSEILIPMDETQTDHLKAYGVAYNTLKLGINVRWLLNYRGGSYLTKDSDEVINLCNINGVKYEKISAADVANIMAVIN